ncbi:MAG: type II toxin-antitoxin system RelE/ParE family toxin [Magnetococcales bacterium]|nr:type II toxin-antitoxin system RelE/ParE family toxin [Magnetococcales bacterium]
MAVYKNKWFAKFANKEHISDIRLCEVVKEIINGKIDADYGGGLVKQRIAREDAGKSGGYRAIILYRRSERVFFVYGFAKNRQENISQVEERAFKDLAEILFSRSVADLKIMLETGMLLEVSCDEQTSVVSE